jgi:hypothetical protein
VTPNPQHPPTLGAECSRDQFVAQFVCSKFPFPECLIVAWHIGMFRTGVPETAVNENRQLCGRENEIRLSEYRLIPPPAGYLVLTE